MAESALKALATARAGKDFVSDIEALFHESVGFHNRGRFADAVRGYDNVIRLNPNVATVHSNRGAALCSQRLFEDALLSFDRAVDLNPGSAEAHNNRGNALANLRRLDDAILSFERAIAIRPTFAEAHYNRANALKDFNRQDEAVHGYDCAIALKPDFAEAHCNRGNALKDLQRWEEALASYDVARALKPDMDFLFGAWLYAKLQICDFSDLETQIEDISSALRQGERACTPFQMLAISGSPELQKRAAETYLAAQPSAGNSRQPVLTKPGRTKIRLGYFSADFHDHATMHLMAGLFEQHDRSKFELTAFSFGPDAVDEMRVRAVWAFDRFIDVRDRSDEDIALLSRDLGIDIAIDLKGFTQGHRTGIFAIGAAPVQINYLGYPGTMGAQYMDYIIADDVLIPADQRRHYREKIVALPNSYQVNDRIRFKPDAMPDRTAWELPATGFVFCCFNNNYKITPSIFDCWMRILKQCPGSVLWLLADNAKAASNLKREAAARGIDPERLIFAPRLALREHLTRLRSADLFLDTLPYNAHTTASEALWAGLPILTCAGDAFASRVAASVLSAAGLPELITTSLEAYEALALEIASHPDRLASLKQKLAAQRLESPLFDTSRFTRNIEAAYAEIHERRQAGLPPADIRIAEQ